MDGGRILRARCHANVGSDGDRALHGHSQRDQENKQQTLETDHDGGGSYHGTRPLVRYRLLPDRVLLAEFRRYPVRLNTAKAGKLAGDRGDTHEGQDDARHDP
jgi:hypothetical protein